MHERGKANYEAVLLARETGAGGCPEQRPGLLLEVELRAGLGSGEEEGYLAKNGGNGCVYP